MIYHIPQCPVMGGVITYPCVPRHNALGNDFNFRANISVFNCSTFKYYRIGWPEWHGASRLFWCTNINIICNHIPKVLQVCNCLCMLYTCMAWICNYTPHKTGKRASLYLDGARGGHLVMKRWPVPDCRKLLALWWHMLTTSQWDIDYCPLYQCLGGGCSGSKF